MGKSKKFILASLYPLAKACGFSDLKISIITTCRSNFGSYVCMERPVGIVTPRALLRRGAKQYCLRALGLHDVADDDMNRVAPNEPHRFIDEQALTDLEKLLRGRFVHRHVAVGYPRSTDCAYLALGEHRFDVTVNRGNPKVWDACLARRKNLFDVEGAR